MPVSQLSWHSCINVTDYATTNFGFQSTSTVIPRHLAGRLQMPRTGLVIGPTAATPPGLHSNRDRFRSQAMTIPAVPIDPPLTGDSAGPPRRAPSAIRNMVVSLLGDVGLPVAAYFIAELLGASTYRSL